MSSACSLIFDSFCSVGVMAIVNSLYITRISARATKFQENPEQRKREIKEYIHNVADAAPGLDPGAWTK